MPDWASLASWSTTTNCRVHITVPLHWYLYRLKQTFDHGDFVILRADVRYS